MKKNVLLNMRLEYWFSMFVVLMLMSGLNGCSPNQINENNTNTYIEPEKTLKYMPDDDQLLDDTFRIDIQTINVIFDYYPESGNIDCVASVTFKMRPGQRRPLIHLDPLTTGGQADRIILNGETLSQTNSDDIKIVKFQGSLQKALEFQRDLAEDLDHSLEIAYRINIVSSKGRFMTWVNDLIGDGNESLFPTINTPHELARHRLTFRVHSDKTYRCIGSGLVQQQVAVDSFARVEEHVQQWLLDTEREIASYTIMFSVVPEEGILYEERKINGVDVRLIVEKDDDIREAVFRELEECLPIFENDFGAFPMPRGLSLFVFSDLDISMEYYGASIASLGNLRHEVFHMYFGCSTINKTYRDSWLDEAINYWYKYSGLHTLSTIGINFKSGMVGDRSPIREGFDGTYYHIEGSQILQTVAYFLGSREEMIAFLRYLRTNHTFAPYTTFDFVNILKEYSGIDMTDWFMQWCYNTPKSN